MQSIIHYVYLHCMCIQSFVLLCALQAADPSIEPVNPQSVDVSLRTGEVIVSTPGSAHQLT